MKYIKTFEDFTNKEVSTDLNEAVINNKADAFLIKMGIPKEKLADFKEAAISFITDEIMDEPGGFAEDIFEFYSTTKLDVLGDYAEDYLENEDESKSETGKELNERERLRYVGTYRAKNGKIYKKWKDDENYIAIEVNGTYVTIEGDGETKSQDEVMKEIEDALKESTVTEGKVNEYSGVSRQVKDYVNKGFEEPEERLDKIKSCKKERSESIGLTLIFYWTQKGKLSDPNEFSKLINLLK